jgi:diguanylate cyclase (GGDEF)-like protein/PAS domain S-box-containing protein
VRLGIGLSTRITVAALLLVLAGGLLWINKENDQLHRSYLSDRSADIETALHVEKVRMGQSIETLRQDVVFLANTPPISGIIRASANYGLDSRDKNSYATWEARLQEIFAAFLRAHPEYYQVRYIGAAGEGMELVRVERRDVRVEAVPHDALQAKGDQDYFRAGLMLTAGRVHLSEFDLSKEHGTIEVPHRPTLRAVTTVFDASGRVFGMVVINKDLRPLFDLSSTGLPPGVRALIADQQGHYLHHPDSERAFEFEFGSAGKITDDFPSLAPLYESQTKLNKLSFHAVSGAESGYLAAERVFFDTSDPSRFLLLAYHVPEQMISRQVTGIPLPSIMQAVFVMLVVGLLFMLVLRRTFAPLSRITAAAMEIAAGNRGIRVPGKGGGEVGELARALNVMLDKLLSTDQLERENAFRKELIESLPGIFYMLDAQGRFLMWNRNLEQVLQCGPEELANQSALNFFRGEHKVKIENAIQQVLEMGSASVEALLLSRDGTATPYHFTGRFVVRGETQLVIGLGRDITGQRQAEAVLSRHKTVIETAHDGYWLTDALGNLQEANEAYAKLSGYPVEELKGMHISQLEAQERSREEVLAHITKIIAVGYDVFETRHRHKDGHAIDVEVSTTFMQDTQQFVAFVRDISARKRAEEELRVSAAAFETQDAILITDAQSNIIRVNRAFSTITGYSAAEVIGRNPKLMSSGRHDREFYTAMWKQLLETGTWAGEIWDRRKSGEIYPKWMTITAVRNEQGETSKYVAIFSDITQRKQEEEEIRSMAFYDALTKLPNRRLFLERFQAALASSARYGDHGAILFIDLDNFKQLNDTLGHDYGDLLLVEVARRIKACVREIDTVARMGGDEFVVLLENISSEREDAAIKAGLVAEKIRDALAQPYQLRECEHDSSPSIGISLYHGNAESMEDLLKYADQAMYQAKSAGRNAVRYYDADLQRYWEAMAGKLPGAAQ